MGSSIRGSKSHQFIQENVPNHQDTADNLVFSTVQEVSGKRAALDTVASCITEVDTGLLIGANSRRRLIHCANHGARRGWIMKPTTGNSTGEEIPIVKIIDTNYFVISAEFDLGIGDEFSLFKFITQVLDANGNPVITVNVNNAPVKYLLNGVAVDVTQDDAAPANNKPFPVIFQEVASPAPFFIDAAIGPLLDASVNSIPDSVSAHLELVPVTPNAIKKIQVIDDIGAFMALYTGTLGNEQLLCGLGLGGSLIEVDVPAGERISIRSLSAAINAGSMFINFLG